MGLTDEHVGPKILAKNKIYVLTRAELLFTLCYEMKMKSTTKCFTVPQGCRAQPPKKCGVSQAANTARIPNC